MAIYYAPTGWKTGTGDLPPRAAVGSKTYHEYLVDETLRPLRKLDPEEYTEEERPTPASIRALETRLLGMTSKEVGECDAVPNGMGGCSVEWERVDGRRVILMSNRAGDAHPKSVFVYWSTREFSDSIYSPTVEQIRERLAWLNNTES